MPEGDDNRAIYPSLRGKKVLITGGGSGIGAGIVEAFARQGCDVTFIDILNGPSEEHAAKTGSRFERVDLTDTAAASVEEVTEEYWDDRLNVNLKHHFFSAQAVLPGMRAKGGGSIVSLGSISWHLALPDLVLYQTSKAAIEGLTRSLARDLGPDNIRVNCVVPGNVKTPRQEQWYTPEGEAEIVKAQCIPHRLVPEDVAALVVFLASDDAKGMTGHEYFVDAGWR